MDADRYPGLLRPASAAPYADNYTRHTPTAIMTQKEIPTLCLSRDPGGESSQNIEDRCDILGLRGGDRTEGERERKKFAFQLVHKKIHVLLRW